MRELDHRGLAEALLPAVLEAGRVEMAYFDAKVAVERKADKSPVTAADREAEAILVAALARAAPGVPIIAEEAMAAGAMPKVERTAFLVDPLDGTKEFIAGSPEFTVNIGLIADGQPVFGLIFVPATGDLYLTDGPSSAVQARVSGASTGLKLRDLDLRPLKSRTPDRSRLVALASRRATSAALDDLFKSLNVGEVRRLGSSLKFCLIAAGEADLYARLGETSEWDTAAGQAILVAAGGSVVGLDGRPLAYLKGDRRYLNPPFLAWSRAP